MNKLEKQRAFDYSTCIMLSSYFDNITCTSDLQRKKLCLAYQELKDEDKDIFDGQSIALIEKELLPNLPTSFLKQNMKLSLVGSDDRMYTEIRLSNEKYLLRVKARYGKRKPELVYEIWKKGTPSSDRRSSLPNSEEISELGKESFELLGDFCVHAQNRKYCVSFSNEL